MQRTHRRSIARRLIAAATVAVVVSGATLATSADAAATRPSTESGAVAASAERALDALETWRVTRRPAHYVQYLRARDQAAEVLGAEIDVSGDELAADWADTDERKQIALLSALTQLGVPYRSYASEPEVGFDCSGLTSWAWAEAGIEIPRSSGDQMRAADDVERDDAVAGDLVYYPGHVSMYLGEGLVVHSPNSGNRVEVIPLTRSMRSFGDPLTDEVLDELDAEFDVTETIVDEVLPGLADEAAAGLG